MITRRTEYINHLNFPVLPAAILQSPFFSNDRPQYMIYGGIGYIIGHEIIHGFDNKGRQYDMNGDKVDWWAEETNKRFLEKEKCFINQYGNYSVHGLDLKVCLIKLISETTFLCGLISKSNYYLLKT